MNARVSLVALVVAGGSALACSVLLDFEPETPQCWCGERWQGQVSGALAIDQIGATTPIPQTDTAYSRCVSQSEHVALNEGDPTLTNELVVASIA